MQEIASFWINKKYYTIYDVDKIEGKDSYIGETRYEQGIILIERGPFQEMIDTLGHELAHVWLYENGHPYQDGGCFTYEDLCEFMSFSWEFIEENVEKYIRAKNRMIWRKC